VLGVEHADTLRSKYMLAHTLIAREKYAEAEQVLRQLLEQQERVLGPDHKGTLASKALLQKLLHNTSVAANSSTEDFVTETVLRRLSDFFANDKKGETTYTDSEIQQISLMLTQLCPQWSKVPRTYITLRVIGCLDLLDNFIDVGFSDHWFPVTERSLPPCLRPGQRLEFVSAQGRVITKSMDLEKGSNGQHCHFRQQESPPFEEKGILGSRGFGQVDRVVSLISFREYARKRVPRSIIFRGQRTEDVKQFIAEIEILKRLKHRHVVDFVGSYTDPKYIGLIMSPVAEMDLSTYLAHADAARHGELRTFFGCLARALAFLHEQKVRHKDIKPGNILVHGGNVLFTDFGLSLDFANAEDSTTLSMVKGMTPKYCAPEVALEEPRNTSSDIWSLGIVFLEMFAVLKHRTVEYVYNFLEDHGSQLKYVRSNPNGFHELVVELKVTGDRDDDVALGWIVHMLEMRQKQRPTALSLVESITAASKKNSGKGFFCGICCLWDMKVIENVFELYRHDLFT
jgi:hypothetical protein